MPKRLYNCGFCCFFLSAWGTIQLTIMGIAYKFEAVTLFEDCEVKGSEAENYYDFLSKVSQSYKKISMNCFIAATFYFVFTFVSVGCIRSAEKRMRAKSGEAAEKVCRKSVL